MGGEDNCFGVPRRVTPVSPPVRRWEERSACVWAAIGNPATKNIVPEVPQVNCCEITIIVGREHQAIDNDAGVPA